MTKLDFERGQSELSHQVVCLRSMLLHGYVDFLESYSVLLYSDSHLSIPDSWRGHDHEAFQLPLSCSQATRRKLVANLEKEENNKEGWKQTDILV